MTNIYRKGIVWRTLASLLLIWSVCLLTPGTAAAQSQLFYIEKNVDVDTAYPGDTLTYTVATTFMPTGGKWSNQIFDFIPPRTVYVPGSVTGTDAFYKYNQLADSFYIDWMASGTTPTDTAMMSFKVVIDPTPITQSYTIINKAYVPGGVPAFDTAITVVIPPPKPEMKITKQVDSVIAYAGDTLTYTLTIENIGNITADNVQVLDTIPALSDYAAGSATLGGIYDTQNDRVLWNLGTFLPGDQQTVEFKVVIDPTAQAGSIIYNHGNISAPVIVYSDTVQTEVIEIILDIDKEVDSIRAYAGDTLTYKLIVTNLGSEVVLDIDVVDTIPLLTTYAAGSITGGGSHDPQSNTVNWTLPALAPQLSVTLLFKAVIDPTAPDSSWIDNMGWIIYPDSVPSDTVHTLVLPKPPPPIKLAIIKQVDSTRAFAGDTLTYTLNVINQGVLTVDNVEVSDDIPLLTAYTDRSATSGGIYDPVNERVNWPPIASMAPGDSVELEFKVVIDKTAPDGSWIDNFAWIISPDSVISDTVQTLIVPLPPIKLEIEKAVTIANSAPGDTLASPGDTLIYSLFVKNAGVLKVDSIAVIDTIPDLSDYVSGSVDPLGDYNIINNRLDWTIPSLQPSQIDTLVFKVTVDLLAETGDSIVNQAAIIEPDTVLSNEVKTFVLKLVPNELLISKTVSDSIARPFDTLVYTVTVTKLGFLPINNIVVTDTIPDLVGHIVGSATGYGQYNPGTNTITWDIPSITTGFEQFQFHVIVDPDAPDGAIITNWANIIAPEPVLRDNAVTRISFLSPDVVIEKSVDPAAVRPGDTVTYTIVATNNGPGILYEAVLIDDLPDDFELVPGTTELNDVTATSTETDPDTVTIGTFNVNDTVRITYDVAVPQDINRDLDYVNIARIDGRNEMGEAESYGPVETLVILGDPDLIVTKAVSPTTAMIGDFLHYTITVENQKPILAESVELYDEMPVGIYYIDSSCSRDGAAYTDPNPLDPYLWSLGDLPTGEIITIEYTAVVGAAAAPGPNENKAWAMTTIGTDSIGSDTVRAVVHILSKVLPGSIRGKVIVDCDGDGVAEQDSIPAGIDIYLDDGSQSQANEKGMFYFNTVRAGERVVALDERDLDGYKMAEGQPSSVFAHVHETSEAYILFRICPEAPRLKVDKMAARVPQVLVTKVATLSPEGDPYNDEVVIDYEVTLQPNQEIDPERTRVIDQFPGEAQRIVHDNQDQPAEQVDNKLVYDVNREPQPLEQKVLYSLKDMPDDEQRYLTNSLYLEADPSKPTGLAAPAAVTAAPVVSPLAELPLGPFARIPARAIDTNLIVAYFVTAMADIRQEDVPRMQALADTMKNYENLLCKFEGHADIRNIRMLFPSNWELSEARSKSVYDWFVAEGTIEAANMSYERFAATRPVDTGRSVEALAHNRRVEAFITGRTKAHIAPVAAAVRRWVDTTTLELEPYNWDTLMTASQGEVKDVWEVRLIIENTSSVPADDMMIKDLLPQGALLITGSVIVNDKPGFAEVEDGHLVIHGGRLDARQKAVVYYRIKAGENETLKGEAGAKVRVKTPAANEMIVNSNKVTFK
ncbi:MAG: DUF11 domain-containing protein [FCB group bacterium]|nr:DUF11 domain-containing protein [FCB group bacterium]